MRNILVFVTVCSLSVAACSSVQVRYVSANRYAQPNMGAVCLLPGGLPESFKYREIAIIKASIKHNASRDRVGMLIANKARALGANAVLNLQTQMVFRSPLPWAVVGPRGNGVAISSESDISPSTCESFGGITQ